MIHKKIIISAILIGFAFGSVLEVPPVASSMISDYSITTQPISNSHQNEIILDKSDSNVEVYKRMHYFEQVPFQLDREYNISLPKPSRFEGDMKIENMTIEMIENSDLENPNLIRWFDESDGIPDSTKVQRLNSSNEYDYSPSIRGENFFLFFNANSFSKHWLVDYFANVSVSSHWPSISFQYSKPIESNFLQQNNMGLHIEFDFEDFSIIFILHKPITGNFNYNTTMDGKKYVHFLLNNTWGPNWVNVGPINVTKTLLSLGMYSINNLPPIFHLNRILVDCIAQPPFQFHLLMDNISLKTPILPSHVELSLNGTHFTEIENKSWVLGINGFATSDLILKPVISKSSYFGFGELTGIITVNLWVLQKLSLVYNFIYKNQTCIIWDVFFDLNMVSTVYPVIQVNIHVPLSWVLNTINNPIQDDISNEIFVHSNETIYSITNINNIIHGTWHFKAYAPNYIKRLQLLTSVVDHNSIIQLNLSLLSPLSVPVILSLKYIKDNTLYYNTTLFIPQEGVLLLNIPINTDFPKGNYVLTSEISDGFCVGIQYASITISTHPALLFTEVPQHVHQYEEFNILLQMIDRKTRLDISADYYYSWNGSNETKMSFLNNNSLSSYISEYRIETNGLSPGNHTLSIIGRSSGYSIAQELFYIVILPSSLVIEIEYPECIIPNDIALFKVVINNNYSNPASKLDVFLNINDNIVNRSITDNNGYSLVIWRVPTNISKDISTEIIIYQQNRMLGNISRNIHFDKGDYTEITIQNSNQDNSFIYIAIFIFCLSSLVTIYRFRNSRHKILFGDEISQEKSDIKNTRNN